MTLLDRSDGELHGRWEEHALTKFPLEADHVECSDGSSSLEHQSWLAIPGYFAHVLLSPVVLLLHALDSNHGSSMPVMLYAIALHARLESSCRH